LCNVCVAAIYTHFSSFIFGYSTGILFFHLIMNSRWKVQYCLLLIITENLEMWMLYLYLNGFQKKGNWLQYCSNILCDVRAIQDTTEWTKFVCNVQVCASNSFLQEIAYSFSVVNSSTIKEIWHYIIAIVVIV